MPMSPPQESTYTIFIENHCLPFNAEPAIMGDERQWFNSDYAQYSQPGASHLATLYQLIKNLESTTLSEVDEQSLKQTLQNELYFILEKFTYSTPEITRANRRGFLKLLQFITHEHRQSIFLHHFFQNIITDLEGDNTLAKTLTSREYKQYGTYSKIPQEVQPLLEKTRQAPLVNRVPTTAVPLSLYETLTPMAVSPTAISSAFKLWDLDARSGNMYSHRAPLAPFTANNTAAAASASPPPQFLPSAPPFHVLSSSEPLSPPAQPLVIPTFSLTTYRAKQRLNLQGRPILSIGLICPNQEIYVAIRTLLYTQERINCARHPSGASSILINEIFNANGLRGLQWLPMGPAGSNVMALQCASQSTASKIMSVLGWDRVEGNIISQNINWIVFASSNFPLELPAQGQSLSVPSQYNPSQLLLGMPQGAAAGMT